MIILGLGGLLGDAASVLLKDGKPQAAAEETKIARTVRPGSIPEASINECLRMAHVRKEQVNVVAVARPLLDQICRKVVTVGAHGKHTSACARHHVDTASARAPAMAFKAMTEKGVARPPGARPL